MTDLDKFARKLKKLGGNPHAAVKKGMEKALEQVRGTAEQLCPVDTGLLRGGLNTSTDESASEITGKVFTNIEYAPYVEYGTGRQGADSPSPPKSPKDISHREDWNGMPAQPFLYPALTQNANNGNITRCFADALQDAIKEAENAES